jgi:hypothetical protein
MAYRQRISSSSSCSQQLAGKDRDLAQLQQQWQKFYKDKTSALRTQIQKQEEEKKRALRDRIWSKAEEVRYLVELVFSVLARKRREERVDHPASSMEGESQEAAEQRRFEYRDPFHMEWYLSQIVPYIIKVVWPLTPAVAWPAEMNSQVNEETFETLNWAELALELALDYLVNGTHARNIVTDDQLDSLESFRREGRYDIPESPMPRPHYFRPQARRERMNLSDYLSPLMRMPQE